MQESEQQIRAQLYKMDKAFGEINRPYKAVVGDDGRDDGYRKGYPDEGGNRSSNHGTSNHYRSSARGGRSGNTTMDLSNGRSPHYTHHSK